MKSSNPFTIALIAGLSSTSLTFWVSAGAQNGGELGTSSSVETAIFAGGCFWCVESDFDKVDGVIETTSGYIGGHSAEPTYKSHTKHGHYEAVKITYDSSEVSYDELVTYFFQHIDPTDDGGQFCDRGNSYRTAVFAETPEQRLTAENEISKIDESGVLPGPVVTKVIDASEFWPAEDYHQDYYLKNRGHYNFYRSACRRDSRVAEVWGKGKIS